MKTKPRARKTPETSSSPTALKASTLKVFDIPLDLLVGDDLNPNEMKEDKFDLLVQEIQDSGFDEPIIVIPHPKEEGKYLIAGGHHRTKAARVIGMETVPAVIKDSWGEDQQKIALVKRNIVHGSMNSAKFTALYTELARTYDAKLLQTMLGFTEKKEFDAVYEGVERSLTPKQRTTLAKSKEKIKSVDDLTSVLHKIFKDQGSEADTGYMVFSFGGKNHHYVQIDDETDRTLTALKGRIEAGDLAMSAFVKQVFLEKASDLGVKAVKVKSAEKSKPAKRPLKKRPIKK